MRPSNIGLPLFALVFPVSAALYACGSNAGNTADGGSSFNVGGGDSSTGNTTDGGAPLGSGTANGTFTSPDCPGCTFPATTAPSCGAGAPAIHLVYPPSGVLLPPNMNTLSIQWTPSAGFSEFEVDLKNAVTDMRFITKCSTQTMDTSQPPQQSGGCEIVLDASQYTLLAGANRGHGPVTVSVRGTTGGTCASSSTTTSDILLAQEDVLGAIYYWKSTITANGTGGQIWVKSFGDSNPEQQVTGIAGSALSSSCNGCHALSRDGTHMVVYSDDDDSDDEYGDVSSALVDVASKMIVGGGMFGGFASGPAGFQTFNHDHSYYLATTGDGSGTF
ncbi:MAG: hypothetical protein ACREJ3_09740, partial [Polyangiaceae bacterium]